MPWSIVTCPMNHLMIRTLSFTLFRTYNIHAISFTPAELVEEMKKYYPDMEVTYEPDDRQAIGMSLS